MTTRDPIARAEIADCSNRESKAAALTTMTAPNHLVIVCGHAIWLGGPKKGFDESEWLIESYKSGETPTFIEHIKAGIKILSEDEGAVVMFSG